VIDLKDKVVMIAGANGGIGSHVAEVLVECGATTALSFRNNSARVEEVRTKAASAGTKCHVAQVDMTSIDAAARWAESVVNMYGKIDAAVNCCGSNGPFMLFADQDPSGWREMLDIELMSSVYLSKAVVHHMVERKQGRIISLGSDSGKVGNSGSSISAAARGGLQLVVAQQRVFHRSSGDDECLNKSGGPEKKKDDGDGPLGDYAARFSI